MGLLRYGRLEAYEVEDRLLEHLRVVIDVRLQYGEKFCLTWPRALTRDGREVSFWISPAIPLVFEFSSSQTLQLNPVWLKILIAELDSDGGVIVIHEDEAEAFSCNEQVGLEREQRREHASAISEQVVS